MAIDYAKKSPQATSPHRRFWLICLLILLVVLAIPALFYVHYMHMPHFHHTKTIAKPILKDKKISHMETAATQTNFDFYAMLPKMQVNVKKASPTTVQIPAGKPYYLLQVATSTQPQAAQQLVTKLGVMGLNAYTKTTTNKSGQPRYQILVGPYIKDKNASTDQSYLRSNHINSIKFKITNYP